MSENKKQETGRADVGKSTMVEVEVYRAISIDGVAIRPNIEDPRGGKRQIVNATRAIIPRERAIAFGPRAVKIVASAPDDAQIGVIAAE